MAKRMYLVQLTRKKVLVEATSQEAAIREATKPLVKSCTIPTPLEVARLMQDDTVEVISETVESARPKPIARGDAQREDGVGPLSSNQPPEEGRSGDSAE